MGQICEVVADVAALGGQGLYRGRRAWSDGKRFKFTGQIWGDDISVAGQDAMTWALYSQALTQETPKYWIGDTPDEACDRGASDILYLKIGADPDPTDPAIGIFDSQGVSLFYLGGDVVGAKNLAVAAGSERRGKVQAGTLTAVEFTTDLTLAADGALKLRAIIMTGGALQGDARRIRNTIAAGGKIIVETPFRIAPSANDPFVIV